MAREISKYIGYLLGLETSNIKGNLMSNSGFNLNEDQKSVVIFNASRFKKDIRETKSSNIFISHPITMSPLFEYRIDCKVYDEVIGDKCLHDVVNKIKPLGLILPESHIESEMSFLDFLNSKNPCNDGKSYMDKLGYSYL